MPRDLEVVVHHREAVEAGFLGAHNNLIELAREVGNVVHERVVREMQTKFHKGSFNMLRATGHPQTRYSRANGAAVSANNDEASRAAGRARAWR